MLVIDVIDVIDVVDVQVPGRNQQLLNRDSVAVPTDECPQVSQVNPQPAQVTIQQQAQRRAEKGDTNTQRALHISRAHKAFVTPS